MIQDNGGMLDLYEEFRAVIGALEGARIPYAICGGFALAVHGFIRTTVDIDLLLPGDRVEAVKALLLQMGYEERSLPMTLSEGRVRIRRLTKIDADGPDTLMVDLLLAEGELSAPWAGRQRMGFGAGEVSVVSREGLVSMKRLRASSQDLTDIQALERGEGS